MLPPLGRGTRYHPRGPSCLLHLPSTRTQRAEQPSFWLPTGRSLSPSATSEAVSDLPLPIGARPSYRWLLTPVRKMMRTSKARAFGSSSDHAPRWSTSFHSILIPFQAKSSSGRSCLQVSPLSFHAVAMFPLLRQGRFSCSSADKLTFFSPPNERGQ